ncbi:MAG TPA: pyridoxamine 5'-phosphate oxidase [Thermoanaerobaculia bacterium]|nr:pyridoxamine 5'-phosphate oxidase [Thermoanaerobaculia bacterium]
MQYDSFRPLRRADLDADPIAQFRRWLGDATAAGIELPEGMILSSADRDGRPSARTVLLKHHGADGFVFFTNYLSRKARELDATREAALLFWWRELGRQVRIEGGVEKVRQPESDAYFATRPRASQIAAWASDQSGVVESREILDSLAGEIERKFRGSEVPRPPHWGGYAVIPERIELWQGRPDRLHDRFLYTRRDDGGWDLKRLAP